MQTAQGNMLLSLRTVQAFLEKNAVKLAGVTKTGARKRLDDAIIELSTHASDQTGSALTSQGATRKQKSLRTALLRDHMAPIARIARVDLPQAPEIEPLRMPRGRPAATRLAAAANGMAKAAEPFSEVFIAAGLPADFIVQLTGAADVMLDSLNDRAQSRGKQKGATRGLRAKLTTGRKIVHVLDAFVRSALTDDPALLASWNLVKRVQKAPGRPAGAQAAAPVGGSTTGAPGITPTPVAAPPVETLTLAVPVAA